MCKASLWKKTISGVRRQERAMFQEKEGSKWHFHWTWPHQSRREQFYSVGKSKTFLCNNFIKFLVGQETKALLVETQPVWKSNQSRRETSIVLIQNPKEVLDLIWNHWTFSTARTSPFSLGSQNISKEVIKYPKRNFCKQFCILCF